MHTLKVYVFFFADKSFKTLTFPLVQISSKPAARSTFHWRFPLSNVSERNRWARL
jgi:hypothetical protein